MPRVAGILHATSHAWTRAGVLTLIQRAIQRQASTRPCKQDNGGDNNNVDDDGDDDDGSSDRPPSPTTIIPGTTEATALRRARSLTPQAKPLRTMTVETGSRVSCLAHDGRSGVLVSGHADGSLQVWARAGSEWERAAAVSGVQGGVSCVAARAGTARGEVLVAAGGAEGVGVYRVRGGAVAEAVVLGDGRAGVRDVAFADDGVLGVLDGQGVVRVYRGEDAAWVVLAAVEAGEGCGLSFMPGGSDVFCAGSVVVARARAAWDYVVFAELDSVGVTCVDWGRSGHMAAGREDGSVEVWEMRGDDTCRVAVLGGAGRVVGVRWDLHGRVLAVTDQEGGVKLLSWTAVVGVEGREWRWAIKDKLPPPVPGGIPQGLLQ